ncbi:MAG: hypothetical protein IJU79_02380 [Desulfovibrionaceae bacterium]|nr:hypothetical protein [Desulfovibrionaceae bacterium]
MATKLEIINNALLKVGLPLAATLDDADWNATIVYDTVAKQALRSFAWGFAMRYANLAVESSAPNHGFTYKYGLPEATEDHPEYACLRVLDVRASSDLRAPKARFAVAGLAIYTNVSPCHVRYIGDFSSKPNRWPDDFADAVSCKIAAEIANLSAQTVSMTPGLLQMYQLALAQAQAIDSTETNERVPLDESILASRSQG